MSESASGRRPGPPPEHYRSVDEDSRRWASFSFRRGDIVVSTRSKSGTTWMQMICALLVFGTPDLPAPLGEISPWIDWLGSPLHEVLVRLEAQDHRRVVKTHTPLDGLPLDPRATWIVVARDPLDMAVSLYHQGDNLDRVRMAELTGQPPPTGPPAPRPAVRDWLLAWIDWDGPRRERLDSLPGVMWHLGDAWARRAQPGIVLVHYDDLLADLEGEMRRLAGRLGITVAPTAWPALVEAAGLDAMRTQARRTAPAAGGILRDPAAFFRRGSSGAGRELLTAAEITRYLDRCGELAPADMLRWLHR